MSIPRVDLIWSQSTDSDPVIGINGHLPWYVPEDLRFFHKVTTGHVVVMGRKTWDSLPAKPLKDRTNVVITRSKGLILPGAETSSNLIDALEGYNETANRVFVIGGQELFTQAFEFATRLHVTEIDIEVRGRVGELISAPRIDPACWKCRFGSPWYISLHDGVLYRQRTYDRIDI